MMILDRIALIVSIIGALNWGSVGLFQFDLVSWVCGGASTVVARIIYTVVALAGVWCISLLFRSRDYALEDSSISVAAVRISRMAVFLCEDFKLGVIGSIRNSEFGIRNSELREDERFNRFFASVFLKSLGYQCLLTRHQVPVFDRAPPS